MSDSRADQHEESLVLLASACFVSHWEQTARGGIRSCFVLDPAGFERFRGPALGLLTDNAWKA